jgi:flagellar basal-body rod modification protein FlgD
VIESTNGATTSRTNTADAVPLGQRATGLGREAFLQLLVTQLGNQNPLAPQADGEFIAQLAQFSSLEQLTNMSTTLGRIATALGVASDETK